MTRMFAWSNFSGMISDSKGRVLGVQTSSYAKDQDFGKTHRTILTSTFAMRSKSPGLPMSSLLHPLTALLSKMRSLSLSGGLPARVIAIVQDPKYALTYRLIWTVPTNPGLEHSTVRILNTLNFCAISMETSPWPTKNMMGPSLVTKCPTIVIGTVKTSEAPKHLQQPWSQS